MGRHTAKLLICICLAAVMSLALCSCGAKVTADISGYGDTQIKVTGLKSADFYVTPNELKELACVSQTAEGKSKKAGKVQAVGPTLQTVTEHYGGRLSDYSSVLLKAADGYSVSLSRSFVSAHSTIVISLADGDKALTKSERPARLLIPGAESSYWIKMITEIDYEK